MCKSLIFQWVAEQQTEANQSQQAEDGKTELSLMHFTVKYIIVYNYNHLY